MPESHLSNRIALVRSRIEAAARRAGRDPDRVGLVAITKGVSFQQMRRARESGVRCMGESRVQEALAKRAELKDLDIEWHFVGHLQTNKAAGAVGRFALIHSVDSLHLLEAVGHQAARSSVSQRILLQVNVAEDPAKFGFRPAEVAAAIEQAHHTEGITLEGFMTLGPKCADPEGARPTFVKLRQLRDQEDPGLETLSMGMTHDFEVAVEEGATLVRVGTGLFGSRDQAQEDG